MVFSISKGLANCVCGHCSRISRIDNIRQHLDRLKFCLWTPPHNFRQINTNIAFIVWDLHCIYCMVFSFSKSLILNSKSLSQAGKGLSQAVSNNDVNDVIMMSKSLSQAVRLKESEPSWQRRAGTESASESSWDRASIGSDRAGIEPAPAGTEPALAGT